eukprot:scaffold1492_cov257-Pinguiococcus_pyrenoidosus.AAC.9
MRVRCPAACELTPTAWTSASMAWRGEQRRIVMEHGTCIATSSGVWKSGPTSTSKPRSLNPDATTFAPRSCPS